MAPLIIFLLISCETITALRFLNVESDMKSDTTDVNLMLWNTTEEKWDGFQDEEIQTESGKIGNWLVKESWRIVQAAGCGKCGQEYISFRPDYFLGDLFGKGVHANFATMKHRTSQCSCPPKQSKLSSQHFEFPPYDMTKHAFFDFFAPNINQNKKAELEAMAEDFKDALVVYLRAGDALKKDTRMLYYPAPCAFYNYVINNENNGSSFKKVVIVSTSKQKFTGFDGPHPCIKYIQEKNKDKNVVWEEKSTENDWMKLMAASNVALSTSSTFGMAATMMNIHEKPNIHLPTFSYVKKNPYLEYQDGYFHQRAHDEICGISEGSKVYEIPGEKIYEYPADRPKYIMTDEHFTGAKIHTCGEKRDTHYFS